jgi:hypothetical protein
MRPDSQARRRGSARMAFLVVNAGWFLERDT